MIMLYIVMDPEMHVIWMLMGMALMMKVTTVHRLSTLGRKMVMGISNLGQKDNNRDRVRLHVTPMMMLWMMLSTVPYVTLLHKASWNAVQ